MEWKTNLEVKVKKFLFILTVFVLVGVVILGGGLMFAGCGGGEGEPSGPTEPTEPTEPTGPTEPYGTVRVGVTGFTSEFFDVSRMTETVPWVEIYDYLIPQEGEQRPGVAKSWEIAADGLSWIIELREGIKFSNGEDLTAEDVKFSLERCMGEQATYAHLKNSVDHIEVVDPYTIQIFTKGTQPYLWSYLSRRTPPYGCVMPKDYIEANGWDYFEEHPIGSGPYTLLSYTAGDEVQLEAVPDHWSKTSAFQYLIIQNIPEESTRVAMLQSGELDVIQVSIDGAADLADQGYTTGIQDRWPLFLLLYGVYQDEGVGTPIANLDVRKALSLSINREEIINTLFHGQSDLPLGPGIMLNMRGIDSEYWADYAAEAYRYDLDEARDLLEGAGYGDGCTIKLWSYPHPGFPDIVKLCEVLQGYWAKINVTAEIVPIDITTFVTYRKAPSLEYVNGVVPAVAGFPMTIGNNVKDLFHTGGVFHLFYGNPDLLDSKLEALVTEMDPEKSSELFDEVEKICIDSYAYIGVGFVPSMIAVGPEAYIDFSQTGNLGAYSSLVLWIEHAK
jgi:peptide/nickel transport system substrate-binding protein